MKRHIEKARGHLGELGELASKTEAAERKILAGAEKRHAAVLHEIEQLQPGIDAAGDDVHEKYLDLVGERGQLEVVIARARKELEGH